MTGNVEIFSGIHGGTSLDKDLVQRCWDLSDLANQYQDFVDLYLGEFQECKNSDNGGESLSPQDSFIRRFWLMYDFQSFPNKDPNLPTILLPSNWVGFKARNLFDEYYKLLEFQANQFIDSIIDQEEVPN